MGRIVAPPWMNHFRLCCRDGGLRDDTGWFLDDFTSYGGGPSSSGKQSLIRGEGFVTRISSNIRPQDPGGGAARLAASPGTREDGPCELSVVEPQSAPSRISVVLVEEAKVGGAHRMECPRVDQDLWLLAGVAKPPSVTVCEDSHLSPSVEGMLSSPDLTGKLFPVVPARIPLPVGPVGPVGPCGMTSPSDLTSIGPVGPITDPVGPVGSYGMLSPCDSDQLVADGPVGPYCCTWPGGLVWDVIPM